jgi:penicillin-binding protein 1B
VGNELGVNAFVARLKSLGLDGNYSYYPSLFLGAVDFSPLEMLGLYQVFAASGQRHQLHTIRYITDTDQQVIDKHTPQSQQVLPTSQAYLLNYLLQQVFYQGSAQKAYASLPASLALAGKTGTTNNLRDSWFAGYSGNRVAVVWLGADKNTEIGLSGSNGALPVWTNIMKAIPQKPVLFNLPLGVQWHWLDGATGVLSAQECEGSVHVPLLVETIPSEIGQCAFQAGQTGQDGLQFDESGFDSEFEALSQEGANSTDSESFSDFATQDLTPSRAQPPP